jgi:hypothetical protein
MRVLGLCVLITLLVAGCAADAQFVLTPPKLAPVSVSNPLVKLPPQAPDDIKVEVRHVCRGSRGCVLLVAVANQGDKTVEFKPGLLAIQLSSGYRQRVMTASEFQTMCSDFGADSYGIGEQDEATVAQWRFAEENASFVIKPGESKELPLPIGAQAQEAFLTLGFDPALRRANGANPAGQLLVAVALPDVLPAKKRSWPDWLHFGFAFTNAG